MLILKDLFYRNSLGLVAINQRPIKKPWGGANQFIVQLADYLRRRGYRVTYRLRKGIKSILLIAPRPFQNVTIDVEEIDAYKKENPYVKCVHRINQTNRGRNSPSVDNVIKDANSVADHTVFISKWIRDYEIERWYPVSKPHNVIHNGADDNIFYPKEINKSNPANEIKIVTHHWSDNWNKGFEVYKAVDAMIASGDLQGFSLSLIGRWPKEIIWESALTFPPKTGRKLAEALRSYDLYLTGAVWEAGGMHHIEAAQCGLPVVFHKNGGGIPELASRYGIEFSDNVKDALLEAKSRLGKLHERVRNHAPSGKTMCKQYMETMLS